ncbi:MAG TPA: nuclear transport factor 2 family protein [Oculatellaceae cyanobacterium]
MSNEAVKIARAFFEAMANKDIDGVMDLIAREIGCESPNGHVEGAVAYRELHACFAPMIEKLTLESIFGDDREALLVYRADTTTVKNAYVADHLIVKNGKIVSDRVIYDRTPFMEQLPA